MTVSSDKFHNVPSHQEVSGLKDVDNINTFSFTDSVYAFEDVTNEPRDNTFDPFDPNNSHQNFKAKIDNAFNRNLPSSFKSVTGPTDNPAVADLTLAREASGQNILTNTNSSGIGDEETLLVVSDVAVGEDRSVKEEQKVTDNFADSDRVNTNTHHEPASVLPELSDSRNSVHSDQGQPQSSHQLDNHPVTDEEEEADSKKESRIVETFDSNKITVDQLDESSKSLDNKQILWRSEDVSVLSDQDDSLEARTDPPIKKQHQQRLPKKLHENSEKRNKEFTFVDLPNLDKIDEFATVIEKNDTEGNVRRTVIIKNIPEAIQAFGVRNAPFERKISKQTLKQGNKIPPNLEKTSTENIQVIKTPSILDQTPKSTTREENSLLNDKVTEIKNDSGDDGEKLIKTNSDKLNETDENNVTVEENELFQTFINNDTNGNVQRTIVIKNTPEALKMFGIENVPLLFSDKAEPDSIKTLNEQIDEVFKEDNVSEENENLFTIHDNEETTDFEYINDDYNLENNEDFVELDAHTFNPLKKLRMNNLKARLQDAQIETEEESQTLKTLFYEDLPSLGNIIGKEEKNSLENEDKQNNFEFKSPEFNLQVQSFNLNDFMDDIDIDLFNLKESDERMPKILSELISSDNTNGIISFNDKPSKNSDHEQQIIGNIDNHEAIISSNIIRDSFEQDSSQHVSSQFETIFVKTEDPLENSENPSVPQGEFLVYSETFLDTEPLSEADLSLSPRPDLLAHTEHEGNNIIFADPNSFAKDSVTSEGQIVTLSGSDNFSLKTPEPKIVIPSTLDHEQNNQFISSSQISSFLSDNKSPSGTNPSDINEQNTQNPGKNHEISRIQETTIDETRDNNILTKVPPDHDIVKNQDTGPSGIQVSHSDKVIFSKVNNHQNPSHFVRFPTDDESGKISFINDISSVDNQNILQENNFNNVINQNKASGHNHNNHNSVFNSNNNIFLNNQNTVIKSQINHNQPALISSNVNNVFNQNINKDIINNNHNEDIDPKISNNKIPEKIITPVPMNFRSASGRLSIPVTFQYGFEPMTRAPPLLFSPTPGPKLSLLNKPLPIPQRTNNIKHFDRPRRTNVVEFYQQPSVLDRVSGWFIYFFPFHLNISILGIIKSVSNSVKHILL